MVLNKVLSRAVYFGNRGSPSNQNIWKLHVHKGDRWGFSLGLIEIKTAVWSFCCIISSFTIQKEVTAYAAPEGASAPTALWQAGSRQLLQAAHSTEVPSQAQAGTHWSCLHCCDIMKYELSTSWILKHPHVFCNIDYSGDSLTSEVFHVNIVADEEPIFWSCLFQQL